jgi:phosphoribosylformylglycinamidine synthase PurS subunit
MRARVFVTLRPGVLDPQGRAVGRSLVELGFAEVERVRVGKLLELDLAESDPLRARERVAEMCERLLVNGVVEGYEIEIV